MSLSIDDEEAKDRLLDGISQSVKELQREHCQGEDSPAVTNDNVHLQRLCQAIDQVFLCGLNKREQGYWKLVQTLTRSEAIHFLEHLPHVKTSLGRGRAWMYLSLNENVLESYLRSLTSSNKLIDSMYSKGSFLRDEERLFTLQTLVTGMDFLTFELTVDSEHFDRFGLLPVATNCDLRRDLSFDYTSSSVDASRTFRLRHSPMKAPSEESMPSPSWSGIKGYLSSKAAQIAGQGASWSEEASEALSTSWRNLKSRWASGGGSAEVTSGKLSSPSPSTTRDMLENGSTTDGLERRGELQATRPTFRRFLSGESSDSSSLWRQYSDGSPAAQAITSQNTLLPEDGLPVSHTSDGLTTPTKPVAISYKPKTEAEPTSAESSAAISYKPKTEAEPTSAESSTATSSSSAPVTWSSTCNVLPDDPCIRPKSPVAEGTSMPSFKTRGRRLMYGQDNPSREAKTPADFESSLESSSTIENRTQPDAFIQQGGKKGKKKKKKVKVTMAKIASPAPVADCDDVQAGEHSSPESSINIAEKMAQLNQQLLAQQTIMEEISASKAAMADVLPASKAAMGDVLPAEVSSLSAEEPQRPLPYLEEVEEPQTKSTTPRDSPPVTSSAVGQDMTDSALENSEHQLRVQRHSPAGSSGSASPAGVREPTTPTASLSIYDQFTGDVDNAEEDEEQQFEEGKGSVGERARVSPPLADDKLLASGSKTSLSVHSTASGRTSTGSADSCQDMRPPSRSSPEQRHSAQSSPWRSTNDDERGSFAAQPLSSQQKPISSYGSTVGQVRESPLAVVSDQTSPKAPLVAASDQDSPKANVVEVVDWGERAASNSNNASPVEVESKQDDELGGGVMPERPSLSEADPTVNDVRVDHNLQLMFSLQIFKSSSSENLIKMVRVESSLGRGKIKGGFALLTNYAFYLVHNDGQDGKYAVEVCFPYRMWNHIEIGLNWQTITIVCKTVASCKTLIIGNEPVSRYLVKAMIRAVQNAGVPPPRIDASDSERLCTLEHCIDGFDMMADAPGRLKMNDFRVLRYSMVHWERLNSTESHTLFVVNRAVIKEGPIHFKVSKFGVSYWSEAYAILKDGTFFVYNQKGDAAPKHMIQLWGTHCGGCRRLNIPDRPNCFEVKSTEESLSLGADSREDVALWLQAICEVVAGTISSQPAQCIQCSLVVTANKLYAYLEDFWGGPLQLLSACEISEVTTVFVDETVRTYCTVAFGLTFESGSWLLCFESEYELGMFEEALASAWKDLFQIPLNFSQIGQGPARERARDAVSLVHGRFHRSDSITRGRS